LKLFAPELTLVPAFINYAAEENLKAPVFMASYTLIEGGIVSCVYVHHAVMDGTGCGWLLRLWARCTNASSSADAGALADLSADEPLHRSASLAAAANLDGTERQLPRAELTKRHPELVVPGEDEEPSPARNAKSRLAPVIPDPRPSCTTLLLAFSVRKLQEAKAATFGDDGDAILDAKVLTVNNILSAVLWGAITRVRLARMRRLGLLPDGEPATSRLGFAVDGRSRLGPEFST